MFTGLEDADNILNQSHHQIKLYLYHKLECLEEKYQNNDIVEKVKGLLNE